MRSICLATIIFTAVPLSDALSQTCPVSVSNTKIEKSLAVTDPKIFQHADFSLQRSIGAILKSLSIKDEASNREAFLESLVASFKETEFRNPISHLSMPVDVPSKKAIESLIPSELLDPSKPTGLIPIALFNRLDLAPNDVRDCGEHRIIYSFKKSADAGRLFLIFEAKLKNPHSNQGMRGCLPVAVFWRDLSDEADVEKMAKALENFYYEGLANFGPVVTAKNYGIPLGQIRGNLFDDEHKSWQLREWRVLLNGTLAAETVKNNPLAEFYSDPNFESRDPTLEEERAAFQAEFQNSYFNHLLETDTSFPNFDPANEDKRKEYERSLVNRLGARSDNRFNEFQSVSEGDSDVPAIKAGSKVTEAIDSKLAQTKLPDGRTVDRAAMLARAGAITCAGCHKKSDGVVLGKIGNEEIEWPNSASFVHVTEPSGSNPAIPTLSDALKKFFLPFRRDNLVEAICAPKVLISSPELSGAEHVDSLISAIREQADPKKREKLIQEFIVEVAEARDKDQKKPGYFVENRRPH